MQEDKFTPQALHLQKESHSPIFTEKKRSTKIREDRLEQLLANCQQEILRQIIGPFGLTPAMFQDQDGGSVTTTHNFEKGVTATDEDREKYQAWEKSTQEGVDRSHIDADLKKKRTETFRKKQEITSAYTGKNLSKDGQTHFDHVVAVNVYEKDSAANLFQDANRRKEILNSDQNLVPCEASINMSMGKKDKQEWADSERKKDPGKTNSESFGVNNDLLKDTLNTAEKHVKIEKIKDQIRKQGSELASTSLSEAKSKALEQAFGVLLHEFVTQSFTEISRLVHSPLRNDNFLDEIVSSLKTIADRVTSKWKHALESLISGGIQGVVSNLLTFLINNFVTTAAKVVGMIREGMSSLWKAIKLLINPPAHMSAMDISREVTKIIVASITAAFGMLMEESIKTFITSVPVLAPLANILAPGVTAIATGLLSSLLIYGIDRLFDALQSKGTEFLETMESNAQAQVEAIGHLAGLIEQQCATSSLYANSIAKYSEIINSTLGVELTYRTAMHSATATSAHRADTIKIIEDQTKAEVEVQSALNALLSRMEKRK